MEVVLEFFKGSQLISRFISFVHQLLIKALLNSIKNVHILYMKNAKSVEMEHAHGQIRAQELRCQFLNFALIRTKLPLLQIDLISQILGHFGRFSFHEYKVLATLRAANGNAVFFNLLLEWDSLDKHSILGEQVHLPLRQIQAHGRSEALLRSYTCNIVIFSNLCLLRCRIKFSLLHQFGVLLVYVSLGLDLGLYAVVVNDLVPQRCVNYGVEVLGARLDFIEVNSPLVQQWQDLHISALLQFCILEDIYAFMAVDRFEGREGSYPLVLFDVKHISMDIEYFVFCEVVALLLIDEIVSDLDANIFIIDVAIAESVQALQ